MKILLTNDDGYQSEGLALLCEKLSQNHEVYVVAPADQRSATSHGASFYQRLYAQKLESYHGAKIAYTLTGTPCDCVKYAETVLKVPFDVLISGPNNGENTGNAILYSGTIGAAEEGVLCGYTSFALSRLGRGGSFRSTVDFMAENLEQLAKIRIENTLISINVPDLPTEKIKGVRVVPHNEEKLYNDFMEKQPDEDDCWISTGYRLPLQTTDNDVVLTEEGYITITPLSIIRTNFQAIPQLKKFEK